MLNIIEDFVTPDRYAIKCPNYMSPVGITVHNTANDACAANEINYMKNNNYESSFHFAVDDIEIRQGIPLNRNAWHASDGNGPGNMKTIAIEICYSKSGGERFNRAEENAAQLIAFLCKSYDWDIKCVKRHYDYDTKNHKYCPHRTMDYGWNRYLDIVKDYMDDSKIEINIREGGADMTRERLKYEINRAYLTLVGRNSDTEGLKNWYNNLESGTITWKQFYDQLSESDEAIFKYLIDVCFLGELGRMPSEKELFDRLEQYRNTDVTKESWLSEFHNSIEAQNFRNK